MLGYIISDKENINVKEHEIKSFDILHKTNLNIFIVNDNKILYKNDIIFNACGWGHVKILDWFVKSGNKIIMNIAIYVCNNICNYFVDYASACGHIKILKWFETYGFEYSKDSIINASCYGYVEILEWFKNSKHKFKYDKNAFVWASKNNNVNILIFFVKNHNVKKVIKWSKPLKFNKTIKYKTKNNYIKGYNKN